MRKNNYKTTIHKGYVSGQNWFIKKNCFQIFKTFFKCIWIY
jgi:hypothetical protein